MTSTMVPEVRGRIIRRLRLASGLTQEQLATRAGYRTGGRIALAKIERGRAEPTAERLEGICEALGITPRDLDREIAVEMAGDARERGDVRFTDGLIGALAGPDAAKNARRLRALEARAVRLQLESQSRIDLVLVASDNARDRLVDPFIEVASRVRGMSAPVVLPRGVGPVVDAQVRVSLQELSGAIMGLVTGVRVAQGAQQVGAAARTAVYRAVGEYATSSTGAAIAGLNGAAKHKATLAWLGRGSRATGGLGMAGGSLALQAIVGSTVVLAAGSYAVARSLLQMSRAKEDAAKLTEAERVQDALHAELTQAWTWADQQAEVLNLLAQDGAELMAEINRRLDAGGDSEWDALGQHLQRCLQRALELVSALLVIEALPIWPPAPPSPVDSALEPATGVERASTEWIVAALERGRDLTRQTDATSGPRPRPAASS